MDEKALTLRHLEMARQELGALIDSMDSMGDLGRFLPDLRRVAAHIEADIDSLRVLLGVE
jgi:hypothetical protein